VDEYAYWVGGVELNHLDKLSAFEQGVPQFSNYLFLRLINVIHSLRIDVPSGVKVSNALFLAGSLACFALLLKRAGVGAASVALFLLIAFSPAGNSTTYIMPEAAYAFVFAVLFFALWSLPYQRIWGVSLLAVLMAVLTLLKPHGLFIITAFQIALFVWAVLLRRMAFRNWVKLCVVSVAVYGLCVFGFNTVLGPSGPRLHHPNVVGDFYWAMIKDRFTRDRIVAAGTILLVFWDAVLLLFAPSVLFLVGAIWRQLREPSQGMDREAFVSLMLLVSLALISVVVCVIVGDPYGFHFRYVNFIFPCLLVAAFSLRNRASDVNGVAFRWGVAAVWILAAVYFIHRLPKYHFLYIDCPELLFAYGIQPGATFGDFGLGPKGAWMIGVVILSAAGLVGFGRVKWFYVQIGVLCLAFVAAVPNLIHGQAVFSVGTAPYNNAGVAARLLCGPADGDIVGLGTANNFVPLYNSLATVGRAVPLTIFAAPHIPPDAFAKLAPGACALTTEAIGGATPLLVTPVVQLYRKPVGP